MRRTLTVVTMAALALTVSAPAAAGGTAVPGKSGAKVDADANGFPDEGVVVVGHYTSVYAYDSHGDYYWDLGDGRILTSVDIGSLDDLDQTTLTVCDYVVNYKGTFDNDPFLDSGNVDNHIRCHGYDGKSTYNTQIVHETDPRYRGNPDWSIWGTWEYHVSTVSGTGNLVRPLAHVD